MDRASTNDARTREARRNLRSLIHDTERNRHEYLNPESDKLCSTLLKSDDLYENGLLGTTSCSEKVLEGKLLGNLSVLGKQRAQKLKTDTVVFDPTEFAEKIVTYLGGNRDGGDITFAPDVWTKLGEEVSPCFRGAPPLSPLYGSFVRGEPVKKAVVERRKKANEKEITRGPTNAEELRNFAELAEEETTSREVTKILNILKREYRASNSPLCYFEFVVNPESFSQTIENIFYCSFLVRDGLVIVSLDDDKLPVIQPCEEGASKKKKLEQNQLAFSITKPQFKKCVETFKITSSMIPTRSSGPSQPAASQPL
ncbi:hypothetical protein CAPTEDRAFT_226351 [Capitella teleta]|uniref:Non-structural maintenance of chromosomes element 4 n=1 Tax=Capitella teleta TaxID=283909 RepID=R7TXV7_CAPTE|nr:hypothetical protein CAPTEDRAFT_226351 [Capitella teleta]|eukprot:ELT98574.1 hypothetical protein CAPTEDRAFT_226351 [Capitella teleta]